jgi:UV excision repair protein RAD23
VLQAATKPELPAEGQKLIHSGKVLKDDNIISTCGIKPNDFLVVMVTKAKKEAAPPLATPAVPAAAAPASSTTEVAESPSTSALSTAPPVPPAVSETDALLDEAVVNLTAMGFPEAEVRHCLRAAHGNADAAVEFLTNGIPDGMAEAASLVGATNSTAATTSASSSTSSPPLQSLRNHPQFNDLRRLVQSNPQMLQQVLAQIGQQQPFLLQEINSNQAVFLAMMNEPITETSGSSSTGRSPAGRPPNPGLETMGSPAQMAQMIQSMSPAELNQMAQMMGLSPDQLRMTAQLLGQMPPEQLQQFMMQAMGGNDDGGGMAGMMGGGGQQVLHLTQEEMDAVDRLTEMGFDRSEAAQAFLACDKNEALAANLLMDSMSDGGFFGGGGSDGAGGNDGGPHGSGDEGDGGNDGDDMYD